MSKLRIQFKDNEWMDVLAALNSAIVNAKKNFSKNKEQQFNTKLQISRWENVMKIISERLNGGGYDLPL